MNNWLAEQAKAQDDTFGFEWLPPYSPEINPVEFFNQDYKAYLRKKASRNAKDVIMHSEDYFCELYYDRDRKSTIQSFFRGETCSYSMTIYLTAKEMFMQRHSA